MLADCMAPAPNDAVLENLAAGKTREAGAEYARYVLDVAVAFGRCNEKMAGLRAFFGTSGK